MSEKLLVAVWETLADRGIGRLLLPWQMRREGRAAADVERDKMLVLAQAEREVDAIRRGDVTLGPDRKLTPTDAGDAALLEKLLASSALSDQLRREVNTARTIVRAEELIASNTGEVPPTRPDPDWLYRWRDAAGEVSSEELQVLWAQLLAGEFKAPGSYSRRTLECLRNLNREEAQQFTALAPFVVDGVIWRGREDYLDGVGVSYGMLLSMQDIGLLSGVEVTGLRRTWPSTETREYRAYLVCNERVLWVRHPDPKHTLELHACLLTRVGRELLTLGSFTADPKYLQYLGRAIEAEGYEVRLGDFRMADKEAARVSNLQPLDSQGEEKV